MPWQTGRERGRKDVGGSADRSIDRTLSYFFLQSWRRQAGGGPLEKALLAWLVLLLVLTFNLMCLELRS